MIKQDRCINDPLGQTHSLASSEQCFRFVLLDFEKDGWTTCAKTMIPPTGRDCGAAEWINLQTYI